MEALSVGPTELFDLVDGPSMETVVRWNNELPSIPVRERLLRRLPEGWRQIGPRLKARTEQASTWLVAGTVREFFKLETTITGLLQRMRLSLMKRYFTAH